MKQCLDIPRYCTNCRVIFFEMKRSLDILSSPAQQPGPIFSDFFVLPLFSGDPIPGTQRADVCSCISETIQSKRKFQEWLCLSLANPRILGFAHVFHTDIIFFGRLFWCLAWRFWHQCLWKILGMAKIIATHAKAVAKIFGGESWI